MNTEFENMALLNIEDYNELKAKAEETDEQIKKQAEEMAKPEVVTLKVRFYTYGVSYNPYTCVDVEIPFYDDKKIRDMLNKASADIMKWCDKNMEKFFVDDEYAGTVKLTNLDNGESNISFPSCDDGLIINPADKHIK
jgi:hypothetical protein